MILIQRLKTLPSCFNQGFFNGYQIGKSWMPNYIDKLIAELIYLLKKVSFVIFFCSCHWTQNLGQRMKNVAQTQNTYIFWYQILNTFLTRRWELGGGSLVLCIFKREKEAFCRDRDVFHMPLRMDQSKKF